MMQDIDELARPYALAAFQRASEKNCLSEWSEMLSLLAQIVSDATMKNLVANPRVDKDQLGKLVLDVVGSGCTPEGENFVRVLAEYGRISLVPSIARVFEEERAAHEGRSDVTVISAFELTADQENQISSAMAGRLGTDVTLAGEVDSSLIGGGVIRAGDLVIDASLRGRLNQLSQTLA